MKKLWISFAAVLVVSFAILGWIGTRIYQQMPPLPRGESRAEPVSEYAKRPVAARPAPQGLDQHGRPAPVSNNTLEDDQLEIPAFLRRQAH